MCKQEIKLVRKRSKPGCGIGLFTTIPINKNTFIVEYIGKKISNKVADTLGTKYLFELNNRWTIDGSNRNNLARYINHACKPNSEAEIKKDRIMIYAKKNIRAGEEITIDYGEEYFDEFIKPNGCKCNACKKK